MDAALLLRSGGLANVAGGLDGMCAISSAGVVLAGGGYLSVLDVYVSPAASYKSYTLEAWGDAVTKSQDEQMELASSTPGQDGLFKNL